MNLSLQARVAIIVTLIIVAVSSLTTFLFTSAYSRSRERNRLMRGETLAYALSKAAEEGLVKEGLDLIRKAANVIRAPDVTFVQLYSTIWNCIDAYPFDRFEDAPLPAAAGHFSISRDPAVYDLAGSFAFYSHILFRPSAMCGYQCPHCQSARRSGRSFSRTSSFPLRSRSLQPT